jgi:hypothetical protein
LLLCPAAGITTYSASGSRWARARVLNAMSPMLIELAVDQQRGHGSR